MRDQTGCCPQQPGTAREPGRFGGRRRKDTEDDRPEPRVPNIETTVQGSVARMVKKEQKPIALIK
jgi:hypothetical protein